MGDESPRVRAATLADLDDVARLYVELKRHHASLAPSNPRYGVSDDDWRQTARHALEDPGTTVYVAEGPERTVGFVKLGLVEKPWGIACEIDTLVIEEGARGMGCGGALMRAAEEHAQAVGAKGVRVDVLMANAPGRAFYERLGYVGFAIRYGKPVDET